MQKGRSIIENVFKQLSPINNKYKLDKNTFLSVLEFSNDIIFILDSYGHLRFANGAFLRIWGNSQKGLIARLESIRLQEILLLEKVDYKRLLEHREFHSKAVLRTQNGSLVKVNLTSIPIPTNNDNSTDHLCIAHLVKTKDNNLLHRTIRDKKKSLRKTRQIENRFRSVWENSNDGMCLIDRSGNITICNDALCRIFEIKPEEITARPFYCLLNLENTGKEDVIGKFQKQYFIKGFKKHFTLKVVLKSKKAIELDVWQSFMESNGDSFLLNIFRDVTKIKEAERLGQRNQKMSEVGKVASFIVHEIKSPLACLKMNIDLLIRKTLKPEQTDLVLKILQKEINRLTNILSEVSEFCKQNQLKYSKVSLCELLEIIRALINPILEKQNITFINHIDESIKIHGDEHKLQTALVHLIENSIDAIRENGTIEISSVYDCQQNRVSLFIKDTGCGIKNGERIFEPFYTSKASGVGLGLSIVKYIIEQHNGDIRLISGIPDNTVFEVSFPYEAN